jgi:hypothetical protein
MKDEKPKLVLTKRTIARLNNLEMRHVRGGDGDETPPTRVKCGTEGEIDRAKSILEQATVLMLSKLIKVCDV